MIFEKINEYWFTREEVKKLLNIKGFDIDIFFMDIYYSKVTVEVLDQDKRRVGNYIYDCDELKGKLKIKGDIKKIVLEKDGKLIKGFLFYISFGSIKLYKDVYEYVFIKTIEREKVKNGKREK